jgi:mono/diheme cytochrome c family protein
MRALSRNDFILLIAALALVGFALVVSLVMPRRNPGFPGRHLGALLLVAALLIIAMLTAVAVLGQSHHFASAEGVSGTTTQQPATTTSATTTEATTTSATTTETTPTQTGGGGPTGNATAGKEIFTTTAQPPCSSCHTLAEAGATGQVGPNLDDVLKGKDAAFVHQSIVDPNAVIAPGFSAGIMPATYGSQLSEQQIADLVAFLEQAVNG